LWIPKELIASSQESEVGLKGKRPVRANAPVALFPPAIRLEASRVRKFCHASNMMALKYGITALFQQRLRNVASSIHAWRRLMVPLSFGWDQIEV